MIRDVAQLVVRSALNREVVGSSPTIPANKKHWGCSSVGRAAALHAVGRRFDPCLLHQNKEDIMNGKQSKMLKNMGRGTKRCKRAFYRLNHEQRGKLRKMHTENIKAAYIDFLKEFE